MFEKAVEAAARNHYAYVWGNVNGDVEESVERWDEGGVDRDVMEYHRSHVRPLVKAAQPYLKAEALRDTAKRIELVLDAESEVIPVLQDWAEDLEIIGRMEY